MIHESIAKNFNDGLGYSTYLNPNYESLVDVEKYVKEVFKDTDIELSFDVTAGERLYFKTVNYTTYAGCVTLHPLCSEQAIRQMYDAHADRLDPAGYVDFFKARVESNATKYVFDDPAESEAKKVLVVLPGGNKLKEQCCVGKVQQILDKHGRDNVLFKKHPISKDDIYEDFSNFLGGIHYAHSKADLYDLMKKSEYVYSTLISESALYGHILGKKVGRFDLLQNRDRASFVHINYFLYSTKDPLAWVDTTFSSPKSGIINPEVDLNWKNKVDQYIEYILELRDLYKDAYYVK